MIPTIVASSEGYIFFLEQSIVENEYGHKSTQLIYSDGCDMSYDLSAMFRQLIFEPESFEVVEWEPVAAFGNSHKIATARTRRSSSKRRLGKLCFPSKFYTWLKNLTDERQFSDFEEVVSQFKQENKLEQEIPNPYWLENLAEAFILKPQKIDRELIFKAIEIIKQNYLRRLSLQLS